MAYIKKIITGGGGGGGYDTIQEEGVPLPQETSLNFIGSGITASDDAGNSRTNVALNAKLNQIASSTLSKGVLFTSDGSVITTLTVGTNDAYLVADSTQPNGIRWESAYNVVEEEGAPVVQRNSLNFVGAAVNAVDDPLNARTNVVVDDELNQIASMTFAKGDLITYNGTVLVQQAIGTNNYVLTADSAQSSGMKWAPAAGGTGITWSVVTVNTAIVKDNGYLSNGTGLVFTLPVTAAVGDTFEISNIGTSFSIAQNAGQNIRLGDQVTTTGVTGSLSSATTGDSLRIVCSVANTSFQVVSSMGNITYV